VIGPETVLKTNAQKSFPGSTVFLQSPARGSRKRLLNHRDGEKKKMVSFNESPSIRGKRKGDGRRVRRLGHQKKQRTATEISPWQSIEGVEIKNRFDRAP